MPNRLALAVAALFTALALAAQPDDAAYKKNDGAAQSQPAVHASDSVNKQTDGKNDDAKAGENSPCMNTSITPWHKKPEWWTLIVTALAACIVGWQSWETRKAAQAALWNAQAMITAERPWIVAGFTKSQEETVPKEGWVRFNWEVKNVGRTPARLTFAAARVVFNVDKEPLPDIPDYGEPEYYFTERVIVPGATLAFLSHWYERKGGKYRRLYQTEDLNVVDLLVGFGCVTYRDTFNSGREYVTRFCDESTITGMDVSDPFSPWMDAPSEYTDCT